MGEIKKVGEDYFIEFYARGLKYQQKIGPDRAAAEKALASVEGQIARGEDSAIVRDLELDIFWQDFLSQAVQHYLPATLKRFQALVDNFRDFLRLECPSIKYLSEITPRIIERYKAWLTEGPRPGEKGTQPHLVNFTLHLLRELLEYARKIGYLSDNPTVHIRTVPEAARIRIRTLSETELADLIKHTPEELRDFVRLLALTGLTLKEFWDLQWAQIDLNRQMIILLQPFHREIMLTTDAMAILRRRRIGLRKEHLLTTGEGARPAFSLFSYLIARIFLQGELSSRGPTSLRHTFAVGLIRRGVSIEALSRILGAADVGRVFMYSRYFNEYWESRIR